MAIIGQIRNRLGWLLIAIIGLAIVAFLFMDFGSQAGQGVPTTNNLATVNGNPISFADFDARFEQNVENIIRQRGGQDLTEEERETIKQNTYNEVVNESIFTKVFDKLGVEVGKVEKADMLTGTTINPSIKSSFSDAAGNFDFSAFNNYVNTLSVDDPGTEPGTKRRIWTNFEQSIFRERTQSKYNTLIQKGLTIPNWMADMQYSQENDVVNIEYVLFPYSEIDNASLGITDVILQNYMDKHINEYDTEEAVNLKYVSYPIKPSANDYTIEQQWIQDKIEDWTEHESDSVFIRLYSETPWDMKYYTPDEITNAYAEELFSAATGTVFGPTRTLDEYEAIKLIDRKMIADSLQARHILITGEKATSQEEAYALADSLFALVDSVGVSLSSLTAQFSDDVSTNGSGGDLGWIQKDDPSNSYFLNTALFYQMEQGDVKKVLSEQGIHIVQVYNAKQNTKAVKFASLTRTTYPSEETLRKIYSDAALFAGNNNSTEAFEADPNAKVLSSSGVKKTASKLTQLQGDARQLIKWAFTAKEGTVSAPYIVGDNYVVALVDSKKDEGRVAVNDVNRFLVEAKVANNMKADQIISKVSGTDLASIASSNAKTVASATGLSFQNKTIGNIAEPKVVGAALGMADGGVSAPIQGEAGVYVVRVLNKIPAVAITSNDSYKTRLSGNMDFAIQNKMQDAMQDAADIEDNRFDFF